MYCKQCGKQIADDSVFCQYCGSRQDNAITSNNSASELDSSKSNSIHGNHSKQLFENRNGWLIGYGIYVIINVLFLICGGTSLFSRNYFWPFGGPDSLSPKPLNLNHYDIIEFIVYVLLIPLLVLGVLWYKAKQKGKKDNE